MRRPHLAATAAIVLLTIAAHTLTAMAGAASEQLHVRFAGRAQAAPSFEVVSIKRNLTWAQPGSGLAAPQAGGRYRAVGVTVRRLIGDAFDLPATRLVGGPEWIASARFDIEARAAGDPTPRQIVQMLRPLLAARFELMAHVEARELPVYALSVAAANRLGRELRRSDQPCAEAAANYFPQVTPGGAGPPCGDYRMGAGSLTARGMSMPGLAERLSGPAGRLVIDRTGLAGMFDLTLAWSPDAPGGAGPRLPGDAAPQDNGAPMIFTALREQLGLTLVDDRARVDVLVIDHVAPPSPD